MIRVALDTSTRTGSVAVGRGDRVLAEVELGAQTRHAARALPALADALESAGVGREQIGAVVVGAGPGSFTGVRVAGATAKGLATSLDVPLLAYSSLLALVTGVAMGMEDPEQLATDPERLREGTPICGLFDARRGEVYAGCWRALDPAEPVLAPRVGGVADVVRSVRDALAGGVAGNRGGSGGSGPAVAFVGDGVGRYADELAAESRAVGLDAVLGAAEARPRASALLWLAEHHGAAGAVEAVAGWEPQYVRGSSAERGVRG